MECGNCTLCCKHLNIPETNSKEGEYCTHCKEGFGCLIYEQRPEACIRFECAWKQMQHSHIDLRPDNCGVLFEKWTDKVLVGSTEDRLSELILGQISYFQREGISVLMVNQEERTRTFYLAEGHTIPFVKEEIRDRWQRRIT